MLLFIFDNICSESRGFSRGGFFYLFFFFFRFHFPRIIYVHSLESARAKGQQQQQPQLHQQQQQQQLQAGFSFTSVKMLQTCRSGAARQKTTGGEDESITAGLETDSPSVGVQGRWKQFGSSRWEGLRPVLRPLEFIAGSTRAMFSFSLQHLEHLAV